MSTLDLFTCAPLTCSLLPMLYQLLHLFPLRVGASKSPEKKMGLFWKRPEIWPWWHQFIKKVPRRNAQEIQEHYSTVLVKNRSLKILCWIVITNRCVSAMGRQCTSFWMKIIHRLKAHCLRKKKKRNKKALGQGGGPLNTKIRSLKNLTSNLPHVIEYGQALLISRERLPSNMNKGVLERKSV